MEERGLARPGRPGGHDEGDACVDQEPEEPGERRVQRAVADRLDDRMGRR